MTLLDWRAWALSEEMSEQGTIFEFMAELESMSRDSWLAKRACPWLLRFDELGDGAEQQRALRRASRRLSRDHLRTPLDTKVFVRSPPPTLKGRLWSIQTRSAQASRNFVGIGSAADCDLCFSGPGLRPRHGILRWGEGALTYVSAAAGTSQINGVMADAQKSVELRNQDWLRLGESQDFLILLPHGAYDFLQSCIRSTDTI